jgi:8-oxo-dGTP diphosphatase
MKQRAPKQSSSLVFAVLAADSVVFTMRDGELLVRLIPVNRPPHFIDSEGLPGGLLLPTENAEEAARRHIGDKTLLHTANLHFEQLYTFSDVDRDPRGRVVAVAYSAYVSWDTLTPEEQRDTTDTWWKSVRDVHGLAYDHDAVLSCACERLRSRVRYTTLISRLMPKEFTLTELETAYESVLGTDLDKRNFRKKILKLNILTETPRMKTGGRFRPARLYRFASQDVKELEVL